MKSKIFNRFLLNEKGITRLRITLITILALVVAAGGTVLIYNVASD